MITTLALGGTSSNVLAMIALALAFFGGLWLLVVFVAWIEKAPWKGKRTMQKTIEEFNSVLQQLSSDLDVISESEGSDKPAPDKWSKKEILGHLIDSAANNHQRFVRAQLSAELKLPGYEQGAWVQTQRYQQEPWENLVQLWKSYNTHILHLVSSIPESAFQNYCFIDDDEPVTLEFLIQDYVRHLKHHADQILD
jgi:hypothetical protein